jgi:hypothetical protein
MAIPTKDSPLLSWGANFKATAITDASTYHILAGDVTEYNALFTAFQTAMVAVNAARDQGTRSGPVYADKDQKKADFLYKARELYGFVQDSTSLTSAQKQTAGVNPRDTGPSPRPAPTVAPIPTVLETINRTVRLRLQDAEHLTSRAKPFGTESAVVFWCEGETPAPPGGGWDFAGATTTTTCNVVLNGAASTATTVHICAMWVGSRGELSAASQPLRIDLPAIQGMPVQMKVAA